MFSLSKLSRALRAAFGPLYLQGDQAVANQAGASFRADMNAELQAIVSNSSGATAPATTYAYQFWADTTNGLLKQRNAANTNWMVRCTLADTFVIARAANTIIGVGDYGRTFNCTGSFTQTFPAAATLTDGFWCEFINSGAGVITLDPNGAETIDGVATIRLLPGEACIVNCSGSVLVTVGRLASTWVAAYGKLIYGNTWAVNGADAINDTDIAAGGCMDATGVYWMACGALTKQLDVIWAVGSNAGFLDTGAVANAEYYIWRIVRSDTGVVDALASLSVSAPTMPANYDFKRLIGWVKRVGGTIVAYHAYETEGGGINFAWDTPTTDISLAATLTTAARLDTIKVPTSFSVLAHLLVAIADANANQNAVITCPDAADIAVGAGGWNVRTQVAAIAVFALGTVRTSSSGQIRAKGDIATIDAYNVQTNGFTWARRN
jgi:hypothetical protein